MHNFVLPPTFTLEEVDRKLKEAKLSFPRSQQLTPPDSNSDGGSIPEMEYFPELPKDEVRPLDQCVSIFEKGPRPPSASLSLLNDEEIVQLVNAGKIQPHALEKLLGLDALERAVRVRRAVICTLLISFGPVCHKTDWPTPQLEPRLLKLSRHPRFHSKAMTMVESSVPAARTSSGTFQYPSA